MLKKSILLENKASLSTKNLQLVIKTETRESTIPIEDIGFLVIDHPEIYLSIPAMNLMIENNTSVIICNTNHLPNGMFLSFIALPTSGSTFSPETITCPAFKPF